MRSTGTLLPSSPSNTVIRLTSAEDAQQNKIEPNHSCIFLKVNIKLLTIPYSKIPRQTPPQGKIALS